MIKKLFKLLILFLFIASGAFLWMGRKPSFLSLKWGELDSEMPSFVSRHGVLIIFNSGGWGNTPFEQAEDFFKVLRGIKTVLNKLGWEAIIISYGRTGNNFLGRIFGLKEVLYSFKSQSKKLTQKINIFLKNNPESRVLTTGLSLGADFVGETMKIIGENSPKVLAIKVGNPFWGSAQKSKNILELVNEKDILATGNYKDLLGISIKGVARWVSAKIKNKKLSLSMAIQAPGHKYDWKSPRFRKKIISFLEDNLSR